MSECTVTSLEIYPVKGCQGVSVPEVELRRSGIVGDREIMLVKDGENYAQRDHPQVATIAVEQLAEKSPIERCWVDLNDFEMPIFSVDREARDGIPAPAHRFKALIREAEGVLISLAEHNGSYSVAFKNLLDWTSRIERSLWLDRPLCLMATSPGARTAKHRFSWSRHPKTHGRVISIVSRLSKVGSMTMASVMNAFMM